MRTICLSAILFILQVSVFAQRVENVKASIEGDSIKISYDLFREDNSTKGLNIDVFSSHDEFKYPITNVHGAVGSDIRPGRGKKIYWQFQNELQDFNSPIQFKILPEINIVFPAKNSMLRKGKKYVVRWTGGGANEKLDIGFVIQGENKNVQQDISNTGELKLAMPRDVNPEEIFTLRIENSNSQQEACLSEQLYVKKRSHWRITGPILVVAGAAAAYVVISGSSGSGGNGGDGNGGDSGLPAPPLADDLFE